MGTPPWPGNAAPAVMGVAGEDDSDLTWTVPAGVLIALESVYAEITMGATAAQPLLTIRDQSGVVIATKRQADEIDASTSGSATWALRLEDDIAVPTQPAVPVNVADLGFTGSGVQAGSLTHTTLYDAATGDDGVLVWAMAPSRPAAPAVFSHPSACVDSNGDAYFALGSKAFEANPANVNEGIYGTLYYRPPNGNTLPVGGTITVTWDNPVFDRTVFAWMIRHVGGASGFPFILASTPNFDAAVFASTQVTLQAPDWTPARDNALWFALIVAAKTGGLGGFGAVAGFTGFFQALFRSFTGSKQTYIAHVQTHGADVVLPLSIADPPPEHDVGWLDGGVLVPAFNGVGQNFSLGANAWKGILLVAID